jgi:hypothetical protein
LEDIAMKPLVAVMVILALSASSDTAIRPFHVSVPEEALVALRQRLAATRWPDKETVADRRFSTSTMAISA